MKTPLLPRLAFAFLLALTGPLLRAGESHLTVTWQPLSGLGAGNIVIAPVTCHDWYAHSGADTAVGLISAVNVPPTNNPKEAKDNLNLASSRGLKFHTGDIGADDPVLEVYMDVTSLRMEVPQGIDALPAEEIIRASLECLRRCLPEKLMKAPLIVKGAEGDKAWINGMVKEFNAHNRKKPFYKPQE